MITIICLANYASKVNVMNYCHSLRISGVAKIVFIWYKNSLIRHGKMNEILQGRALLILFSEEWTYYKLS